LSGVYKSEVFEYNYGTHTGHFMIYRNPSDGSKMAIKFKKISDELLTKIARAKSIITDTVEDISNFVEKILIVYEKDAE
jgi:hypothetical protein